MLEFGYINTVNAAAGLATVRFPQRDNKITGEMPVYCPANEYFMPEIGDKVAVLRTGRGASDGLILGKTWNGKNKPPASSGVYKDMGGGTSIRQQGGVMTLSDSGGSISVGEIIRRIESLEARL